MNQATSKVLGKSPKELIDDRILLEAKRLLVHGNKSIKEIGFELGFEEPTNFIKYFRKHIGKTPMEFREGYSITNWELRITKFTKKVFAMKTNNIIQEKSLAFAIGIVNII